MRIFGSAGLTASLVALTLAGCGGDDTGAGGTAGTSAAPSAPANGASAGTIDIDGSSTVFRISKAAQEAYSKVQENVTIVVGNHGTGGGFSNYLKGEVDIIDASRGAKADEEAKAKAEGLEWTRFLVGYDGITIVVNPKNDFVKALSVDQLKALWKNESKIKTWKDLDPSWPDRKIVFYSPDNNSGTFEYFVEAILGKGSEQRDDVQPSPDDNTLVNGVAGDKDAIGYFGFAYFEANSDKLRALPVGKDVEKAVTPTQATILDKSYTPLSRPLYIFVKNAAMKRPEVLSFVKYYLENIENLTKKAGYVPPTSEDRSENQKSLPGGGEKAASVAKGTT